MPSSAEYVPWNKWTRVEPAPLGELTASLSVTVVIPARDCQQELDRTLAALAEQTYPHHLIDVIVVDDASHPPLRLPKIRPESTALLRLGDAGVHGSGRARATGAARASGDVLLFLDADMITDRRHVEAHLRWHHVLADAVVLGSKEFVDVDGTDPAHVQDVVRRGSLEELVSLRERSDHNWLDRLIKKTHGLTQAGDELFTAVVGASLSVSRRLYQECGGFASFDRRGIVDTEFGYRAVTAGAVVVPEPQARSLHQGLRTFASQGEQLKYRRAGLAANRLPHPIFRPPVPGRVWDVPAVRALVDGSRSSYERLVVTVDALLASDLNDLAVTVHGQLEPSTGELLRDYFAADPRVVLSAGAPVDTGFPSQYTAIVPEGVVVDRKAIRTLVDRMQKGPLGLVRALSGAGELRLWRTAALHRARRAAGSDSDVESQAARLFGLADLKSGSIKVTLAEPRTNRTGMVYDATLAPFVEPQVRFRSLRALIRRGRRSTSRTLRGIRPSSLTSG